ncbi:MAG: hypothetical protein KDB40_05520 [Acidimicrobiales bacterium]|nr:hypothetical protein [Acidimicrobiales bacterium]MCB9392211.1 hypothetical protein [Acidimicrobiaceae bacterium]
MERAQVDQMDARINQLGASLYFDANTIAHAGEAGYSDFFVLYAGGRAGVMGDVTAEQVCSAFAFFDPGLVAKVWPKVVAAGRPSEIATVFAAAMAHAAEAGWDEAASATVARLGGVVGASVTALGMPLFAGWRALARPSTPQGAAALEVHTLRELRGDVHVQSVAAAGMAPIEAEVATRRGTAGLEMHGWRGEFPDHEPLLARFADVEAQTSSRMQRIYASALSDAQLTELADAVAALAPTG